MHMNKHGMHQTKSQLRFQSRIQYHYSNRVLHNLTSASLCVGPWPRLYDYRVVEHGDPYRGPRTASFATSSLKRSHTLTLSSGVWLPLVMSLRLNPSAPSPF